MNFEGVNPDDVKVIWNIGRRNSHVVYVHGEDTVNTTNGLEWVLDQESGNDRSPNSKLTVGPVSENDSQSTCHDQCTIHLPAVTTINSTIVCLTAIGSYVVLWHYNN